MTGWQLLFSTWTWEPGVIAGCATLLLAYFAAVRGRAPRNAWYFMSGLLILLLALVSPLDLLGDTYLFSAHMLQHMLLILVVPPLLLLGLPSDPARRFLHSRLAGRAAEVLTKPTLAWTFGIGTMWLWHWPALYDAALANQSIHILEHLMFLGSATVFWFPIVGPVEELRFAPLGAVVYLSTACVAHSALAILLTFASPGVYSAYLHPADTLHLLPLIRNGWGLTPAADQQWGGLLMWVPACLVYLGFVLTALARWYRMPEEDESYARG